MRKHLLRILKTSMENPKAPLPVLRLNDTTGVVAQEPFADSPFVIETVEEEQVLKVRRLNQTDRHCNFALIFLIETNKQVRIHGQAVYAPFAFSHAPANPQDYLESRDARLFSTNLAHLSLKSVSDSNGNRIVYGIVYGSQLNNGCAITTNDSLYSPSGTPKRLGIYPTRRQPVYFKRFELAEALALSKASLARLSQLLKIKLLYTKALSTAQKDFHFMWQALRIYDHYHQPRRTQGRTLIDRCYNHCYLTWQECFDLGKNDDENLLLKKAIRHFQIIHITLEQHLEQEKTEPDSALLALLNRKIEPSVCNCSSLFWRQAKAAGCLVVATAAVATTAVLAFGSTE